MRISGGKARGVTLRVDQSATHRPAMDRLRQSIFSSLGDAIEGARVCDLFAGTGSYGLEGLSRGAASATFVEKNKRACAMIKENIRIVAKSMQRDRLSTQILPLDVTRWQPEGERYDLVFVDPPYDMIEASSETLFALFDRIALPDAWILFEMPGEIDLTADGWEVVRRLGKGARQPSCVIYKRA